MVPETYGANFPHELLHTEKYRSSQNDKNQKELPPSGPARKIRKQERAAPGDPCSSTSLLPCPSSYPDPPPSYSLARNRRFFQSTAPTPS